MNGQGYQNTRGSILDRLLDDEPDVSQEPVQSRLFDIRRIKGTVIRDLENLLNTRRHIQPVPVQYREVNRSVFVYGLADFTSQNTKSQAVLQRLWQDIETTVSRFEPRLKNVTVHLEEGLDAGRNIRFRINGLLVVETETEPVSLDTIFDINRGQYVIMH